MDRWFGLTIDSLQDAHKGQTCYIVGKGPSLKHLKAGHFSECGPVITINESILIVQELGISNRIYSMQKDGNAGIGKAVYPKAEIPVILQRPGYSENDLPDHPERIFINPQADFGMHHREASIRLCVQMAFVFGCSKIIFVSCGSLLGETYDRLDVETGQTERGNRGSYARSSQLVLQDVKDFPHEILIPSEDDYPNLITEYDNFYADDAEKWKHAGHDDFVFQTVLSFCENPPDKVLDIGCGVGHTLEVFVKHWPDTAYYGIDLSSKAVDIIRAKIPQGNFTDGPFEDADLPVCDLVLLVGVLEHVKDHTPFLSRLKQVAGGLIFVEVPNCIAYPTAIKEEGYRRIRQGNRQFEWHLYRESWERIFKKNGLTIHAYIKGPSVYNEFIWILKRGEQQQ